MTTATEGRELAAGGRRLGVWPWVALVVVYLVIIHVLTRSLTSGMDVKYAAPTSVEEVVRGYLVPIGVSALFAAGVVTYLRWWRPAIVDHQPVQRWVIVVPVLMVLAIVAMTNYPGLARKGLLFTVLLLVSTLFVGFAEEMMFRGIGLTMFRSNNFTEGQAALWSTVAFGVAHATNLFIEGPKAFLQVLTTIVAGYFLYLIRRRAGTLLAAMLVHGLWDFALISNSVGGSPRAVGLLGLLTMLVLVIVLVVRRHEIEPATDHPDLRHAADDRPL
ncbi:CPBP family intramembrane glutamic endopeptidase [Branchiibius sp. NY16-3462-2]|uniref:CPBP family intramembrane glutamic endopeptidase n=1 Tax=Branchiibius sp. NY16-3462-2 TaxID=1807500 RepID=UPI00079A380B|nr:CPBP family intramembrane glutamic endopeptidase [Branchiibius sp. NY16-3462-2]KYH43306.1 hypothetical protein AZH51_13235 [Branchiibius sp. NY16-3462-2]